jgi:hypothetical protein
MTFKWLDNQGLPRRPPRRLRFERRIDARTASDIADALRAQGIQPAALAMQYLKVDMDVALRVLAGVSTRRGTVTAVVAVERGQRRPKRDKAEAGVQPELADA